MGLSLLWLVPALPLLGALVNGIGAGKLPRKLASVIGVGSVGLAFAIALACFGDLLSLSPEQRRATQSLYTWIQTGDFRADVRLMLDPLSAVMMLVVTGVGFLIHVYSMGYMGHEKAYGRYFAYLNLFTFSMLTLVLADNFLLMFLGWEAVGLCSYLLIGFWYERPAAAEAGKKAFVVNRIGDWGFLLGIFLIFVTFGSVDFGTVFAQAPLRLAVGSALASGIALLLFLGATGKSAQIPLYVWLPDAMEGPTPVSALIHAATMVTAGVYMVARCHVFYLLSPLALQTVAVVGIMTVLLAATIAVTQTDIKRVLAYSTISQLGYMFVGCGVGAFTSGIFHLMTHAFFKALLFLGAGSVIHALSGEQDLWKMGGLRRYLPKTHLTFLIGTLAIAGVIPFAGFFSKDEILFQAWLRGGPLLWCAGILGAFLTAFYMFRLYFLTFHGSPRFSEEVKHHIHESPDSMTIPLMILAVLSTVGGFLQIPLVQGGQILDRFLEPVFADALALVPPAHAGHTPMAEVWLMAISLAVALVGILVAYRFYVTSPETPRRLAERVRGLYRLVFNKYWVDEAYDATVVQPIYRGSVRLWEDFDAAVIDGAVNGVGKQIERGSALLRSAQVGYVQVYALVLTLGAVVVIGYLALR
ncbi:MAG: NADH-quinone oxidoreductase subunit L [Candidatus Eisenbacteria bacterium]|uniref:NADH-quinone oxidoreductase subunit L n=1 Tax=Eiseniibacteriota bacterium TaxID=2212470 RepID=A0A538TBR2_UNCEI|nr:MAG: NADH-quinone oxidoreductase subunit L [Candidatus Eisenbacteria bacterium]TMQ61068.1 MAG: NADH-quinone oxidoreductase subunit L [Candidatus Eisenbacteria bacterium]